MPRAAPRIAAVLGMAVLAAILMGAVMGGAGPKVPVAPDVVPTPPGTDLPPLEDPFRYDPGRREEFEARAAAGNAHVLYARSPEGAYATAERVARWRDLVDRTAERADVDADMLEALVFLESAGNPEAMAPQGTEGAVGLTQIVAETGQSLLGMRIDVAASSRLTRRLGRARSQRQADRIRARRRAVDERFDPRKALAASGRYLELGEEELGQEQLSFVSYHMGIGNLGSVLRAYAGGEPPGDLRYAQVYFDSSPTRHPEAWEILSSLGDDSSNYLWKLLAAKEVMRAYRTDPQDLRALEALQLAKNSAEEVLHPAGTVPVFEDAGDLREAWDDGDLAALPVDQRRSGLRIQPQMGELARRLDEPRRLYHGLRPEALAMALYIAAEVRAAAGDEDSTLTLTSTVRDRGYQRLLVRRNPEATDNYSLHTTGFAFDVLRRYSSRRQAEAFQFVLDRLTSLNLIAWVREPAAIHVTVASDASALTPLLERVASDP